MKDDRDDCLDYGSLADALAELIDHPDTGTPLTIALSGPWGAGKTTLARMVERRLLTLREQRGEPRHITCWFNAWMHDDAQHLGSAFTAEVATQANKHRTTLRRFVKPLPSAILSSGSRARRRVHILGASLILAGFTVALSLRKPGVLTSMLQWVLHDDKVVQSFQDTHGLKTAAVFLLAIPALLTIFTKFFSVAQGVAGFVKDPAKESTSGSIREVSEQLGRLYV